MTDPGLQSLLPKVLLCMLLLVCQASLFSDGHPSLPPCDGDHRLSSESCVTSGGPSLLQVARSSSIQTSQDMRQIPPETEEALESSSESGDMIVEEALKNLEDGSVMGVMAELKDTVSASDFFDASGGLASKTSPDNTDALRNHSSTGTGLIGMDDFVGNTSNSSEAAPSCTPSCRWSCTSQACEEECEPLCQPGKCETRCSTMDLAGCMLGCEQPECATICPKHHCAKDGCPKCSTKCSEPLCKLRCPQKQNCTSVCESPSCTWKCQKPESCPEPVCKLECDAPLKECQNSLHEKLPQLEKGEIKVASFVPPSSLLQVSPGTRSAKGSHRDEVLRLGAVVESVDHETSRVSSFVIDFPVIS